MLTTNNVLAYVEQHIGDFHERRLKNLSALKLTEILKRKNPYLFKAKNILTGAELVKTLLDAHLSSQEETIFGEFLEGLAIFVCQRVYGGKKSSAEGIDLELEKETKHYIISIKSGPNWGNSRQISKMRDDFRRAKKVLGTSSARQEVIAINGCCYGYDNRSNKGDYFKLCGQEFWTFLSGTESIYLDIIQPLGHQAKERNEEFHKSYAQIINAFTADFGQHFYTDSHEIDWDKLVKFNSGKK